MGDRNRQKTLVLGHRNPDTDSICSAICYANLKEKMTGEEYEPCRAGNLNPETQFVLKYFKLEPPPLSRECSDAGKGYRDPKDEGRRPRDFFKKCLEPDAGG